MKHTEPRNISMMMDLYEMTMANGYFKEEGVNNSVTFDVFYRKPQANFQLIFSYLGKWR